MADEEAVITQDDKIVGDARGPGTHYIIPLLQKVHIIKKHLIRKHIFSLPTSDKIKAVILWNVSDSKKYYLFTRSKSNEEIKEIINLKIEGAFNRFDTKLIKQLIIAQEENSQYMDKKSAVILKQAQDSIEQFGINIKLIDLTGNTGNDHG